MESPELVVRRGSERSLLNNHPWVYSGAVVRVADDVPPGALVDVTDHRGRFIGRGHYNSHSPIRVRILSREKDRAIDSDFYREVISQAWRLRQDSPLPSQTDAMRLVHGENDGLPGVVADSYGDFLVVQFHTFGSEQSREQILDALWAVVKPRGIYERSDVGTRRAEGLSTRPAGPLRGDEPPELVPIEEYGVRLFVDVYNGQKTGFFLDQRQNRALLHTMAGEKSVLNAFSYTAGFSAHALNGGAAQTLDLDIASSVLPAARENLAANRPSSARSDFVVADVFQFLADLARRGPIFDVVVLDPPSLLRKRADYKKAMGVYIKLNRNALKLVNEGGLLVTSSCSGRISQEDFFAIVQRAAASEKVNLRVLAYHLHPIDHPVRSAFPEGRYLKTIFAPHQPLSKTNTVDV